MGQWPRKCSSYIDYKPAQSKSLEKVQVLLWHCERLISRLFSSYTDVAASLRRESLAKRLLVRYLIQQQIFKTPQYWAFVNVTHPRSPVDSLHRDPVMKRIFPCDDVIMYCRYILPKFRGNGRRYGNKQRQWANMHRGICGVLGGSNFPRNGEIAWWSDLK